MKVSIIIPVYNEALAIREILTRVIKAPLPINFEKEIIIVDDGSTDTTMQLVEEVMKDHPEYKDIVKTHHSLINHGKGAALRAGFKIAKGEIILIQDGDLEYNPKNYVDLLAPFENDSAEVVYGSRFMNGTPKDMRLLNLIANYILTIATRVLYGQKITDEATGFKVFKRELLDRIDLKCRGFEFCPEFTAEIFKKKVRFKEVAIEYNARGILEGKKIKARDGFIAFWILIKKRFT